MKFATAITDDFVPGLLALIKSIEENGEINFSFAVIKLSELSSHNIDLLKSLDTKVELFDREELGKFEFDKDLMMKKSRYQHLNKLLVYKLPYDEKMCLIDADMLCLGDISEIEDFKPISAGLNIGLVYPENVYGRPMFNTGLMVFEPDNSTFEEIQKFASKHVNEIWYGDQAMLNLFYYKNYPSKVNILDFNWNVLISSKIFKKGLWEEVNQKKIKFLHYTILNPWNYSFKTFKGLIKDLFYKKEGLYQRGNLIYNSLEFYKEIKMWKYYYNKTLK